MNSGASLGTVCIHLCACEQRRGLSWYCMYTTVYQVLPTIHVSFVTVLGGATEAALGVLGRYTGAGTCTAGGLGYTRGRKCKNKYNTVISLVRKKVLLLTSSQGNSDYKLVKSELDTTNGDESIHRVKMGSCVRGNTDSSPGVCDG